MIRFNAVVGNPPYQESTNADGIQAVPVYREFVNAAKSLHPSYLSLIIPARWYAGGIGLNDFRTAMLSDEHLAYLVDFPKSRDCFPTVDIAGGICYFLCDETYNNPQGCEVVNSINGQRITEVRRLNEYPIFVRDNRGIDILHKLGNPQMMSQMVLPISPFGLPTSVRGKETEFENSVALISSQGKSYIDRATIHSNEALVDQYKVWIGQLNPDRAGVNNAADGKSNVTTKISISNPGEVTTATYLVLGAFATQEEAENLRSYIKCRLTRFLIQLTLSSMHISRDSFQFVPIQDFHESWTDEKLYAKYNISKEEQQYIESLIKPME